MRRDVDTRTGKVNQRCVVACVRVVCLRREIQWCHSIVLSESSSDSARRPSDSSSASECLKGEMWGKSKIPSSSTSMMGMSRLQRESARHTGQHDVHLRCQSSR